MARITVEDCLKNVMNRFELVLVASKRARQLAQEGATPHVPLDGDKPTVVSLREIAQGFITRSILDESQPVQDIMTPMGADESLSNDMSGISEEIIEDTQQIENELSTVESQEDSNVAAETSIDGEDEIEIKTGLETDQVVAADTELNVCAPEEAGVSMETKEEDMQTDELPNEDSVDVVVETGESDELVCSIDSEVGAAAADSVESCAIEEEAVVVMEEDKEDVISEETTGT